MAPMITASLSTVAWRRSALERMLPTILPQVDRLNVFLQGYTQAPDCLRDRKITIADGRDHPDWLALKSTAKLFWAAEGLVADGVHLTVDDDILYPPDYAATLAARIDYYDRKAVVGYHGAIWDGSFRDRQVLHFEKALSHDTPVHTLGTGTTAWHTSSLKLTELGDWDGVDWTVAIAAQKQRLPMMCLARPAGYLKQLPEGDDPRSCAALDSYPQRMLEAYRSHPNWELHAPPPAQRQVVVVMPCYHEPVDRIMRSVDSALAVRNVDRVVVVDDASPGAIVLPHRDRVSVLRRETNGGPAAALATGIGAQAPSAVICRLDVGDEFYPEAKARQIDSVLSGACRASCSPRFDPVAGVNKLTRDDWEKRVYTDSQFAAPTTVYERSVWEEIGGNRADLRWCEDWLFAMRVHAYVGWHMFGEVTCSAGEFPGGHSDVKGENQAKRAKCRAEVAAIGRVFASPEKNRHFFNEEWCKKRGLEPLRMPRK
jgi:hypothetical protein